MQTMSRTSKSTVGFNAEMARRFRRAASLLDAQHADTYRVLAYRHGAEALEELNESAAAIYRRNGLAGLIELPAIGRRLALAIADMVDVGHWRWLDRLEGNTDPEKVLETVPGVGPKLAHRLHTELGIETLEDLERAVYDGRLGRLRGFGDKRWHAARDAVAARLHSRRDPHRDLAVDPPCHPTIDTLLSIDQEYRTKADANQLPTIAPLRFNPTHAHWLPVLHTTRDGHHFTAMFSNTAHAHELGRTSDWVVIFADTPDEDRWTVVTETRGSNVGKRVVRGNAYSAADTRLR
jgi:DNA polymerase (family X)